MRVLGAASAAERGAHLIQREGCGIIAPLELDDLVRVVARPRVATVHGGGDALEAARRVERGMLVDISWHRGRRHEAHEHRRRLVDRRHHLRAEAAASLPQRAIHVEATAVQRYACAAHQSDREASVHPVARRQTPAKLVGGGVRSPPSACPEVGVICVKVGGSKKSKSRGLPVRSARCKPML